MNHLFRAGGNENYRTCEIKKQGKDKGHFYETNKAIIYHGKIQKSSRNL